MRIVPNKRAVAAFTMVEIAISLGVIAIALVAILGVLPTGVRVQRDNREDTILNQEGMFWVEAIRSGSHGLDYLTNYVDMISILSTNGSVIQRVFPSPGFSASIPPGAILGATLTNGQQIVGLLTLPKYISRRAGRVVVVTTNRVTALVRAISGSAMEKSKSARDMAFAYQLTSEVVPLNVYPPSLTNFTASGLTPTIVLSRSNYWRLALNQAQNFYELRLTLQGPVIPKGKSYDVLGTPKTFLTLVSGAVAATANGNFVLPSTFVRVP